MAKPRTTTPTPKRREASAPKRLSRVAPRAKADPSAETPAPQRAPDRRSDMFGLTAAQQRQKAGMGARDAARFERHERYWRARQILGEAVEEMLNVSKVTSKSARRVTRDRVIDLLDSLLKEHGELPQWLPPKKSG